MDAALRTSKGPRGRTRRDARTPAARRDLERIQQARIRLDVATVDLQVAERQGGPFHPAACHFRDVLTEARRTWDRLRAELGSRALDSALKALPAALVELERTDWWLMLIGGETYGVEPVGPTVLAPALWRLVRLTSHPDGPYYAARIADGTTCCDCAEWVYKVADQIDAPACKHLAALAWLGWI